jgi:hypothetical protein
MKISNSVTGTLKGVSSSSTVTHQLATISKPIQQTGQTSLTAKDFNIIIQNNNSIAIFIAIGVSILTAYLTHFFTKRRDRQKACLTTAALLHGYIEELENGIGVMRNMEVWINVQLTGNPNQPPRSQPPTELCPNKFWDSFKPSNEGIYEIWKLGYPGMAKPISQAPQLTTHLKNCFDHINNRYEKMLGEIIVMWRSAIKNGKWNPTQVNTLNQYKADIQPLINGQTMTLEATKYSKERLEEKGNRKWFRSLKNIKVTPGG